MRRPLRGNPVDHGRKGSKLHVLADAQGIPLAVAVSGANIPEFPEAPTTVGQ